MVDLSKMSDEELSNLSFGDLASEEETASNSKEESELTTEESNVTEENVVEESPVESSTSEEQVNQSEESIETVTSESNTEEEDTFDYKAAYLKLRQPFKADGKMVTVESDDEIISLMQKGIGYTSKSQKLQQQVKVAATLEKAGITKPEDLNLLIDVFQKKPEALKKLFKAAEIDPIEFDLDSADSYEAVNHVVSDDEIKFNAALEEVSSSDFGQRLIGDINAKWDGTSKTILWQQPTLLNILEDHVATGTYDVIVAEMERQRLVGKLDNSTPFLTAYQAVGDFLAQKVKSNTVVDKRVKPVSTGSKLPNDNRVKQAGMPRQSSRPTIKGNPLEMKDEDFLKQLNQ